MLQSLEIRNYRNLRHLTIKKLGGVNLLLGKNNTGKTSVLEAISILVNKANPQWLYRILEARGEIGHRTLSEVSEYGVSNVEAISSLFYGRKSMFDSQAGIEIRTLSEEESAEVNSVLLRFAYYVEEVDEEIGRVSRIVVNDDLDNNTKVGLFLTNDSNSRVISLDRRLGRQGTILGLKDNFQFIRTNEITRTTNGSLWDKVTLTSKQVVIVETLKLIESDIGYCSHSL